jgi:erythromycin esterase-like protein
LEKRLKEAIMKYSIPFQSNSDVKPLMNEIKETKIVLLGESSHGTSEYYKIRTEITKRLIQEKDFSFIAVEGDWPACQVINRYIKGYDDDHTSIREVLKQFKRWPTWMWANEEIMELIEWLKNMNQSRPKDKKIGFYGIDVYSLWESMEEILRYFKKSGLEKDFAISKKAFSCFEPYHQEAEKYAISAAFFSEGCVDEVTNLLKKIQLDKHKFIDEHENSLNLEINALVAANAEKYYRAMVVSDSESWNIRDRHMVSALNEIRNFYGTHSKAIVWEHNTHVGDARATDMADEGMVNVGQLIREQEEKKDVYIIGFGTFEGSVIASKEWGNDIIRTKVPPAQKNSWEEIMHKSGAHDKMLLFNDENRELFNQRIGHRAIGVVYNPEFEQYGNYVPSQMSARYDAFIYIDTSNALHPLELTSVFI